ncbi:MAG: hypothetical protein WCD89_23445 [Anaerocolumna sp.]
MKKIFKCIIIIFLFLFIPVALLFVPIGNNIILRIHTNELKHFQLNAAYEILAADNECGKLVGNGNGMQYFSALLIRSKEDLKWENNDSEGVFLIEVNDPSFYDFINGYDYGDYCKDIKKKLKEICNSKNYYVLYLFKDAPLDSIWNNDLRAH